QWVEYKLSEAAYRCGVAIVNSLGNDAPYGADLLMMARGFIAVSGGVFEPKTFQQSWVSAYERVCGDCGRKIEATVIEEVSKVAAKFYQPQYRKALMELGVGQPTYGADIVNLQAQIDTQLIKEMRFSQDRFPTGWVTTYEAVCTDAGIAAKPAVAKTVRNVAAAFRRGPFRAFPEALDVLHRIQGMGCVLYLVTIGDPRLQTRKIDQSGLQVFFGENIYIEEENKLESLRKIANGKPKRTVMVGDSLKNDIATAIELGIRAVLIPTRGHWSNDDATVSHTAYSRIDSISELPRLLQKFSKSSRKHKKKIVT
ncbi:MAG: HAD family hydrolase, partial [Patescibacteria group bacterium]